MSKKVINSVDVNRAVFHLLTLKNNEYSLDLKEDEALEMGISKSDYQKVIKELNETNKLIKEALDEPNNELILTDPKKLNVEALQQTMPSGNLSSNGQEQVGTGFFAPYGAAKVRFSCQGGGALAPVFICRTRALGDWKSKTAVGTSVTWTDIDVDLDASNYNVSITFQTTDSNGGQCNWKAMT